MTENPTPTPRTERTSPALLVVAWAFVSLPLAWGIYMTALGALKLFHS